MEKLEKHKSIVRLIVEEIANMMPSDNEVETQFIADDEHGHYLLSSVGWYNGQQRELNNLSKIGNPPIIEN
jgi:hypothetical protein